MHTMRLRRRFWRRISLECTECRQVLASGRSGASWLSPASLWSFEQAHLRGANQKAPPKVHYPE